MIFAIVFETIACCGHFLCVIRDFQILAIHDLIQVPNRSLGEIEVWIHVASASITRITAYGNGKFIIAVVVVIIFVVVVLFLLFWIELDYRRVCFNNLRYTSCFCFCFSKHISSTQERPKSFTFYVVFVANLIFCYATGSDWPVHQCRCILRHYSANI